MQGPVLVTGGAGFIGSHLVALLIKRGESVRVLDQPHAFVDHLPQEAEIIRGDIRDVQPVERAVHGCREVYHLAAIPHLWAMPRGLFWQVNYRGTVNVLRTAWKAGVRRILHTSTESILTRARQWIPITEDQVVRLSDVVGPYCRSKFFAEQYALRLARAGAPVIVVNPTLPVGPGDRGRSPPTHMILDFCRGRRREYIDAEVNLIDVRDVAEGMIRAMERGRSGRRYLLGNENLSILQVFRLLSEETGLPIPHRKIPYPVALAAAYLSEFLAYLVTHRAPAATVTGVRLTRRTMHFDARASLTELGLVPRPVRESLREAISWFREEGWLHSRK